MKKFNIFIFVLALLTILFNFTSSSDLIAHAQKKSAEKSKPAATVSTVQKQTNTPAKTNYSYISVNSLDLVSNPNKYLNKRVKISAKFDKFSTLGLDYNPALRSSEKYITFLIRRDDAQNDVPLSELKNFMKRELAEKYIDLETNDKIEYSGLVFSTALGDVWLDVENFNIISSAKKEKTVSAQNSNAK